MGMKEFIKKFYTNQAISLIELNNFIVEYCELINKKIPSNQELQMIIQAIQLNFFDLKYAIDMYIIKKELNVTKLYNKNNQLINIYID